MPTKLNFKDSLLTMLIKGAEFKEEIELPKRTGDETLPIKTYTFLLEHYTKYYNTIENIDYKFINALYIERLSELVFNYDPVLFKRAVFVSEGIAPGCFRDTPLLEALVHEIRIMPMDEIELDVTINKVLVGKFIPNAA